MEAMAMGKAIVSTDAGIHGLELARDHDVVVANSPDIMAAAISHLLDHPEDRLELEHNARATAERLYSWDTIAQTQSRLYRDL
jgi:glycosyltransferase involved in cell wall biosynthesis